jgi:hypothetical protein
MTVKVVLFANTDWYLFNFRRSLAEALRDAGHDVLLVSPPGAYGGCLQELGFRWIAAPMQRRSLNPLREFALLLWLRRLFIEERTDLVHGFTVKCAIYGCIAARMASVPARVAAVTGMGYVFTSASLKARALRPLVRDRRQAHSAECRRPGSVPGRSLGRGQGHPPDPGLRRKLRPLRVADQDTPH